MSEACTNYLELMNLVIDGQSSTEEDKALLQHVLECAQCRSELGQLWEIHQTFSDWEEQQVPEGFAQGIMNRIRAEEAAAVVPTTAPKRLQSNSKMFSFRKPLAAIAACAVVCVGLWRFSAPAQPPAQSGTSPAAYAADAPGTTTPISVPKTLTAAPSGNDPGAFDPEVILNMVSDTLKTSPGTILILEQIPEALEGTQYTTEDGDIILIPKLNDTTGLLTQLPSPLMEIPGGDGPVVLLAMHET